MGIGSRACGCCSCLGSCLCCLASPILCCLVCFLVVLALIAGIAVLVLYFVLLPKAPQVTLSSEQVQMFNLTSSNASVQVEGAFTFSMEIKNPNRVKVAFGNTSVELYFQGVKLGNSKIESFTEGAGSSESKTTDVTFLTVLPTEEQDSFSASYGMGTVPLQLKISLSGKIKIWGITSPKTQRTTVCTLDVDVFSRKISMESCESSKKYTT